MGFWDLSDGNSAAESAEKEFDGGGGNMAPMPEGTKVLAMPDETAWKEDRNTNEYLSIRWTVLKPEVYQNRKVFQKLWITDDDPRAKDPAKKRDKALMMLSAIDANAGGKLGKKAGKPSDEDLALALTGKQMVIRLGLYSMDGDQGDKIEGNYVQAVQAKGAEISTGADAPKPVEKPKANVPVEDDSDLPF